MPETSRAEGLGGWERCRGKANLGVFFFVFFKTMALRFCFCWQLEIGKCWGAWTSPPWESEWWPTTPPAARATYGTASISKLQHPDSALGSTAPGAANVVLTLHLSKPTGAKGSVSALQPSPLTSLPSAAPSPRLPAVAHVAGGSATPARAWTLSSLSLHHQ